MYEVLTINQLIDCLDNETPCYVIDGDMPYKVMIFQISLRSSRIQVFCVGRGELGEETDLSTIGLSANHAKVLYLTNKLDKLNIKIDQLKEERRHIYCELVKIKENVVHKEEDCD
jgi:hypothetical protein